jgi:uncharacterized membrane protein YdjX (TVP38/TMEM64 family)
MKSSLHSKLKWAVGFSFLGGLLALILYQYNSLLWIKTVRLYGLFQDPCKLKGVLTSFGVYSPLFFIFLQILQVIVAPIPGEAIEFLGGYLFGLKAGLLYSMIGVVLGSWLAFSLARIFEKRVVEKFVSPKLRKKFDYLIGHEGVMLSFILFLIPGFPKDTLCYILGLTPMSLGIFLTISTIGRIPGTLIATLQGAKAFEQQYKTLLILLGVSVLIILAFYIYHDDIHRWIKKRIKVGIEKEGSLR